MLGYEDIRLDLAKAMGWTNIEKEEGLDEYYGSPPQCPEINSRLADPWNDAEDAEELGSWLIVEGFEVEERSNSKHCAITIWKGCFTKGTVTCFEHQQPDPGMRRRFALIQAAWLATA